MFAEKMHMSSKCFKRFVFFSLLLSTLLFLSFAQDHNAEDRWILIKNGIVVNHDSERISDVLIHGERIVGMGSDIESFVQSSGASPDMLTVLDATGKYVMPGGIDPHTHLDMPFMGQVTADDFFSGQGAALAGGTTFHIDFALPIDHDLRRGFDEWKRKAARGCMDFGFHMAVTRWDEKTSFDMGDLALNEGVNSFKFFMAYKGALMVTDEQLLEGFRRCRTLGALPMVHAENGDAVAALQRHVYDTLNVTGPRGHGLSRPPGLEGEATHRATAIARIVGTPLYVVHVMSKDAVDEVARAIQQPMLLELQAHVPASPSSSAPLSSSPPPTACVIGEAVTSGVALSDSALLANDHSEGNFTHAAQFIMSPPIRAEGHAPIVAAAVSSEGVLRVLATDHCTFKAEQKAKGRGDFRSIPNGVNGIEERMHVGWQKVVVEGRSSPSMFVRMTSAAAAQAFGIFPRKGHLAVGSDADVIVLDPNENHVIGVGSHHSRIDTNVYEGMRIQGRVTITIRRGEVVWIHNELRVKQGTSRYIPLPLFAPGGEPEEACVAVREVARRLKKGSEKMEGKDGGGGRRDEL